jgi:hypothetical protein
MAGKEETHPFQLLDDVTNASNVHCSRDRGGNRSIDSLGDVVHKPRSAASTVSHLYSISLTFLDAAKAGCAWIHQTQVPIVQEDPKQDKWVIYLEESVRHRGLGARGLGRQYELSELGPSPSNGLFLAPAKILTERSGERKCAIPLSTNLCLRLRSRSTPMPATRHPVGCDELSCAFEGLSMQGHHSWTCGVHDPREEVISRSRSGRRTLYYFSIRFFYHWAIRTLFQIERGLSVNCQGCGRNRIEDGALRTWRVFQYSGWSLFEIVGGS